MPDRFSNPVVTDDQGMDHGDPFVMKYLDTYYLYHTGRDGIHLYTSADLAGWEYRGVVLRADPSPEHWAQIDFWAPEVMHHDDTFYMYVAATRKRPDGGGDDQLRRQGIARSSSPLGPFKWDPQPLADEWSIDGHPYRDESGDLWLFYNIRTEASRYWDGTTGCGNVVDRLVAPDKLEGAQAVVAFPNKRWEGNREGTWYWNEGPCVLKRRGVYYQMYSGGFFADDTYGVGFATAPAPRGPWTKYHANPILRSGRDVRGPGHHSVVTGPDGVTSWMVYHGYVPGQKGRKVFIDRLFWAGDRLVIDGPTGGEHEAPAGPVYDPAVPHWQASSWVSGQQVTVGGATLPLGAGRHQVRAVKAASQLRIYVDGVLRHAGQYAGGPDLAGEALTCTSFLDDEAVYELPDGATQAWHWGGAGPLELSLAVRGRASLEAGARRLEIDAPGDRFTLVRLQVEEGAGQVRVTAGQGGATVTDLVLTARP